MSRLPGVVSSTARPPLTHRASAEAFKPKPAPMLLGKQFGSASLASEPEATDVAELGAADAAQGEDTSPAGRFDQEACEVQAYEALKTKKGSEPRKSQPRRRTSRALSRNQRLPPSP